MDENHDAKTVFEYARDQNLDRGIKIDENNFKVLFIRQHAKNSDLYQAVVRVSNEIHAAIENADNKLFVGTTRCPIYDHFHVKRCNRCQGYNHFMDKCKKGPICGKCAGPHLTDDCDTGQVKCANCSANKLPDTNHLASDPMCTSYKAAQKKLEQTIGFYKQKNSILQTR